MPGTANLTDGLLDDLIPVIDELRGDLHSEFLVRPYRVFAVLRTYAGAKVGVGEYTESETEITPQPRVLQWGANGGHRYELEPCGLANVGEIMVTEVSLTYTYDELTGGRNLAKNQQFRIRLKEAQGQGDPTRDFIHSRPPYKDREKDIGWVLWLRVSGASG